MYYAFIHNNTEIMGKGQCPCSGVDIFSVEITEEVYNNLEHYMYDGTAVVLDPDYEKKERQKEIRAEIEQIKEDLNALDLRSIRAIRANDTEYIAQYEAQAQAMREQIQELEKELDD